VSLHRARPAAASSGQARNAATDGDQRQICKTLEETGDRTGKQFCMTAAEWKRAKP
jgi:hypothetical protein